jgi:hypothetical protein
VHGDRHRRAIPDVTAYEALFRDLGSIVDSIRLGDPLGDSAGLVAMMPARLEWDRVLHGDLDGTARSIRSILTSWSDGKTGRPSCSAGMTSLQKRSRGINAARDQSAARFH